MISACERRKQEAVPVLAVRTRTTVEKLPMLIGQSYGKIMQYLGSQGEQPAGMPYVAYYNMDMQDLDVEIGFPVAREYPAQGEVQPGCLPAGEIATCLYTGPYPQMAPAYEALTAWMLENGLRPSGVAYEFYLNEPGPNTPPESLQTQIVFPIVAN